MASPYYRCPKCHNVSRKNDNMFEMVEVSGSNTVFAVVGGVPCPDCGARNHFDDVYLHPKYDVPIEEVYGGKVDINLQLIRRASESGQIRLSEEEKRLLGQAAERGKGRGRAGGSAKAGTAPVVRARQWILGHRVLTLGMIGAVVIGALALVLFGPFRHGAPRASVPMVTGDNLLYGFIDDRGRIAIKPKYFFAGDFFEGLAEVIPQDNLKCGFINEQDEMVIQPQFDHCFPFIGGTAAVEVAGKYGRVNRQGKLIVAPQHELEDVVGRCFEDLCITMSGGKCGYVNLAGESIITPRFDTCRPFGQSLAGVELDGKWGFIDKTGRQIVKPHYDNIGTFGPDGLSPIQVGTKWGFIDKTGRQMIEPQYDSVTGFVHGLAGAQEDDEWGLIDMKGDWTIKPQYSAAYNLSGRLAVVQIGELWGIVDHKGAFVIEPQYAEMLPERLLSTLEYTALVWIKKDDKWGVLDTDSRKVIIEPQFDDRSWFGDKGLARVRKNGEYHIVNRWGEVIWTTQ